MCGDVPQKLKKQMFMKILLGLFYAVDKCTQCEQLVDLDQRDQSTNASHLTTY